MKLKHLAIVYCFIVLFALIWNITACTKKEPIEDIPENNPVIKSKDELFYTHFEVIASGYKYNHVDSTVYYDEESQLCTYTYYISHDTSIVLVCIAVYNYDGVCVSTCFFESYYAYNYKKY